MKIAYRSDKAQYRFAAVSDPQKVASLSDPTAESVRDICHPSSHQSGCLGMLKGTPSQTLRRWKTNNAIERKSGARVALEEGRDFPTYCAPVDARRLRDHSPPVLCVLVPNSNTLRGHTVW
jgi:hypothetical protein